MQAAYQGQISKKEFAQAINMDLSCIQWLKWVCAASLAILLLTRAAALLHKPTISMGAFPLHLALVWLLASPWWIPALQTQAFYQRARLSYATISGFIDDSEITIHAGGCAFSTSWSAYTHYKQVDGMALLYQGKDCYSIFTRKMFRKESEWNQFLATLQSRFPQIPNG